MSKPNLPAALRTTNEDDRIALRGVRLSATVSALSLKATLEQTFVNQEANAVEAIYTFPLPETAAVCGFEVRTGEHVLTGRIKGADDAVKEYDEAISVGNGAFLLEQDRPDVFTVRVGNLKPAQAATIGISFSAPLERVDRSLRLRFPTTIAPRYISASGSTDPLQSAYDGDVLNPPHALHVPYGVTMNLALQLGSEVRGIGSPTHPIMVDAPTASDGVWRVRFTGGLEQMDRDIVLEIALGEEPQPRVVVATGPDEAKYLAVTFVPEFDLPDGVAPPAETVFVVDCSGSMAGESISQAQAALELCLRSLSSGDSFNVCRFGTTFELLAPISIPYTDATLTAALKFISKPADLGGTEIHAPLAAILQMPPVVGSIRNVVVLTDGQVSNEPQVVALAREWRATNRLFTFGIGSAASGYLVRNLAKVTGGAAEFISGRERIEEKVLRTFSRIGSPAVSDIAIRWGDAELQTTGELPPLFEGDMLQTFARAPGRLPAAITLECKTACGPRQWSLSVPQAATTDDGTIATAWARAMIQHLEREDRESTVRAARESSTERRLIALSEKFNLLCALTSFIAVEHRTVDERNAGNPELRRVPIKLAARWGGTMTDLAAMSKSYCLADPLPKYTEEQRRVRMQESPAPASVSASARFRVMKRGASAPSAKPNDAIRAPAQLPAGRDDAASGEDVLLRLLALQSFDGWFDARVGDFLAMGHYHVNELHTRVMSVVGPSLPMEEPLRGRVVSTVMMLAALEKWFTDRRDLWRRAEAKARLWLAQSTAQHDDTIRNLVSAAAAE